MARIAHTWLATSMYLYHIVNLICLVVAIFIVNSI